MSGECVCVQSGASSIQAKEEEAADSAAPGRGYGDIDTETETASSGVHAGAVAEVAGPKVWFPLF